MKLTKEKLFPLILTVAVIICDQVSKIFVIKYIPAYTVGAQFFGDFLRFIHVTNKGIAFSMGSNLVGNLRTILFCAAPVIVIAIIIVIYFRNNDFTTLQRIAICSIIGGGIGNLIDRFFRTDGVVDFIDVKFYGLFGFERWPTFNIADSAVVVGGVLLLISFIISIIKDRRA